MAKSNTAVRERAIIKAAALIAIAIVIACAIVVASFSDVGWFWPAFLAFMFYIFVSDAYL